MVHLFPPRHVFFPSASTHESTVIFLHDRGSNGPELAADMALSRDSSKQTIYDRFTATRWVFPSARAKHFYWTQAEQQQSRSEDNLPEWFELVSRTEPESEDEKQIDSLQESVVYVLRIIDEEVNRLHGKSEKVFIAGLGQGMALALVVLLCTQRKLGGMIGINGWIPFSGTVTSLLERGEVSEAGSYFRRKIMSATPTLQQQSPPHQHPPGFLQPLSASILHPPPPPPPVPMITVDTVDTVDTDDTVDTVDTVDMVDTVDTVDTVTAKTMLPSGMKEIPVFIDHDDLANLPVKVAAGNTAQDIVQKLGFTHVSWRICAGPATDQGDEKKIDPEYDDFTLRVPEQLDDINHFFEDVGLAKG